MDEEWENEFLSTRHVHNRSSRKSTSKKSNQGAFDVKSTYGSYDLKCPSAERIRSTRDTPVISEEGADSKGKKARRQKKDKRHDAMSMEIYRLTDEGTGLVGSMTLPGVLEAGIILAATRKGLEEVRHKIEDREGGDMAEDPPQVATCASNVQGKEDVESHTDSETNASDADSSLSSEEKEKQRFEKFEKNSFRQPKFWLWWRGEILSAGAVAGGDEAKSGQHHSGMGYVVFSGSSCKRFEGTLSCDALGWKDVAFSGWKIASMKERDVEVL